jgi:gas vesicle protein
MENKMDARSLWIGVLAGAVIGAAAGLLLAPMSGKETREMIGERYNDVKEKVSDMTSKVKNRFSKASVGCDAMEGSD